MGWQGSSPNGTVVRVTENGISGSNVWQQEQAAGNLIIDLHHDTHDEDLAVAISQTLNIDGLNAMRANLNMNGFTIENLVAGTGPNDIGIRGDDISGMTFDNGSRDLRLEQYDGTFYEVNIPGAAGGTGTVEQIQASVDGGLETNPPGGITTTGTIKQTELHPSQISYIGFISNMTIDKFGRVISVDTSGAVNTNLTAGFVTDTIQILSSTGSGTGPIELATESIPGIMSTAHATALRKAGPNTVDGPGAIWKVWFGQDATLSQYVTFDNNASNGTTLLDCTFLKVNFDAILNGNDDTPVLDTSAWNGTIVAGDEVMIYQLDDPSKYTIILIDAVLGVPNGSRWEYTTLVKDSFSSLPQDTLVGLKLWKAA